MPRKLCFSWNRIIGYERLKWNTELVSDLPSAGLLGIPPCSIIPDCPIPSEAEQNLEAEADIEGFKVDLSLTYNIS
jgi:hypothetical protein